MENFKRITAIVLTSWALSGCLFDGGVAWEDEEYHVGWIDAEDNTLYCNISKSSGPMKLEPRIVSVGSNDLFVVAKRRAKGGPIQYYYIQKGPKGSSPCLADQTYGPFSAAQFTAITEKLNLPPFEKNFK